MAFIDRRKLALAGAKFRAWWEGEAFDEEAALAAIESIVQPDRPEGEAEGQGVPANDAAAVEAELFEPEPDPRLQALHLLWGAERIGPGEETDEAARLERLQLAGADAVALIGPGAIGPVRPYLAAGRSLTVFEWRSETRARLGEEAAKLAEVRLEPFDLDVTPLPQDAFDGLVSFDEFTYGYAPHLALQMAKSVKTGARAVVDCYVGPPGPDLAHAFASAFAEPQVRPRAEIEHAASEAGFDIEAEDDLTDAFCTSVRARFEALPALLTGESVRKLSPGAARELGWETETWRVRLRMLTRRRLERRRFVLRRRA